jgi:hypothetical protein
MSLDGLSMQTWPFALNCGGVCAGDLDGLPILFIAQTQKLNSDVFIEERIEVYTRGNIDKAQPRKNLYTHTRYTYTKKRPA